MSPRKRSPENKGLPKRWQFTHGAYYYRVPPGQESQWDGKKRYRLGSTLPEAYRTWAERLSHLANDIRILDQAFDRYLLEVVPGKAPKTQEDNVRAIKRLRLVFGHMLPEDIEPQHIYMYVDKRIVRVDGVAKNRTAAHREIEVLSHVLTKCVMWGRIKRHPFKGEVELEGEPPRTRYVEDWEVHEALSLPSKRKRGSVRAVQVYIVVKLFTGMARSDLLRLQPAKHFKEDGIHVQRHKTASKTGKRTIYEWTPELREAVDAALAARPVDISPFLFCTREGKGYINEQTGKANGWDSIWQRFMDRVLKETKVVERFTEHDLRTKVGSDADSEEHARALLAHVDARTTRRVYRVKPERVKPGRGV